MLAMLVLISISSDALAQPSEIDHEELRSLLKGATTAINEQKFENLSEFFHPKLRVTTVNQGSIVKPSELEPYFRSWVGEDKYVRKMEMSMEADELTEFYGEGHSLFGIARGKGTENYDLNDGRHLKLDTRWTATVTKDEQGKWKILALHIGTNFYDNPIVEQFQSATKTYSLVGLVGGLILGLALGLFFGRRGKR